MPNFELFFIKMLIKYRQKEVFNKELKSFSYCSKQAQTFVH